MLDALLDERLKDSPPQRRRGGFSPMRRRSAGPQPAPSAFVTLQDERAGLEQADLLPLLAHQLMTPLALIDTAAQRMMRRAREMDPEEVETRAARIRAATARLSALAQAVLSRAKLGTGQIALDRQTCRLSEILPRIREHVACLQPSRKILVSAPPVSDTFLADPLLIEQVFVVLACNAMKYSPTASEIELSGRITKGSVTLSVKDCGIGIPKEDLPRIFDPFFRAQNAADHMGTGLGLNLADRIVRMHRGRKPRRSGVYFHGPASCLSDGFKDHLHRHRGPVSRCRFQGGCSAFAMVGCG